MLHNLQHPLYLNNKPVCPRCFRIIEKAEQIALYTPTPPETPVEQWEQHYIHRGCLLIPAEPVYDEEYEGLGGWNFDQYAEIANDADISNICFNCYSYTDWEGGEDTEWPRDLPLCLHCQPGGTPPLPIFPEDTYSAIPLELLDD